MADCWPSVHPVCLKRNLSKFERDGAHGPRRADVGRGQRRRGVEGPALASTEVLSAKLVEEAALTSREHVFHLPDNSGAVEGAMDSRGADERALRRRQSAL